MRVRSRVARRHVFVWIQASVKRPGKFTVNIVLTGEYGPPERWLAPDRAEFDDRGPGRYHPVRVSAPRSTLQSRTSRSAATAKTRSAAIDRSCGAS